MTDLRKKVERRTVEEVQSVRRKVIVALLPGDVISFREEGRRQNFSAPISKVFTQVMRWHAEAEAVCRRREKKLTKEINRLC